MKGGEDGIFRGVVVGSGGRRGGRWGREEVQEVGGLLGRDESGHGGVVSSSIDFLSILVDRSASRLDGFRELLALRSVTVPRRSDLEEICRLEYRKPDCKLFEFSLFTLNPPHSPAMAERCNSSTYRSKIRS